ncbi:DNA gyrase subunit B [Dissulfuribacter thermophilus]|uniref:DNA gyrase subunit B n=1 Tax=Dissulfuribacter thermophilus TaxID=1156395 RepID=A0A1B9F8Q0_9BACT|nr:DNA topoisomerase (ATP-hydrolyzing) subunit B [Dissulfuribacter thermophilus]OCC16296.1 DNA gyrase subunit B [Dissulfuribacter thermophilus]
MTQNSSDYEAKQLKVLSGLTAVRKRPAMYIGNTGEEGLHHLVYEVVDNSIDEALAGYCTKILITIHEDNSITIEDNGRGIPVDIHPTEKIPGLELVMTRLHAGGKFDHQTYKVSGGLHGVGVSVVNALSLWLKAEVYRDGYIWTQSYKRGEPEGPLQQLGRTKKTGTKITFKPDPEIFQETTIFKYPILQARMRELAYLNPAVKIILHDERSGEKNEFHYKGGISSFVEYLNRNKDLVNEKPIYIEGAKDNVEVEVAFQYNRGYQEKVLSYVNNIRTKEGGTHVAGFRIALTKCLNKYASDDVVPKKLREKMEGEDVREGLTCVISVRVPNPQFEGQTKTKLGNSEVRSIVASIVSEGLTTYLEENPSVAKKILQKAVEAARAREAARRAKELARKKGSGNELLMAGKLAECQEKDPEKREIFIVEGDSAGGSAKQGRDRRFQAILPLRGKIMNVEKARFDKMLASEEIKQLIAALGTGIGPEDFDPDKVRYHKIIIMTDADVDGAHIRTLLLTFFYRQMIDLIDRGYIYVAQPPLYRVSTGKKNERFLKDDDELDSFLFERVTKDLKIRIQGFDKTFEGNEVKKLFNKLSNYEKAVTELCKKGLWKEVIQDIFELNISSQDQFDDYEYTVNLTKKFKDKGYIVGPINPSSGEHGGYEFNIAKRDLAYLNTTIGPELLVLPEFHRAIKAYQKISDFFGKEFFVISGNEEKKFEEIEVMLDYIRNLGRRGLNIQRYKGLGEMNPDQLWETTMNPEKRRLLRVTISDANEAENLFTTLMGDKVEPRKEFIQQHALEVEELDI